MERMNKTSDVEAITDILKSFPGPVTLVPSLGQYSKPIIGCGLFTVAGVLLSLGGDIVAMLCAAFFGLGTVIFVITFLPGASALRLNETGFDVTRFYRTRTFRWNEVSDFGAWTFRGFACVVFKVAKSRLSILEKINTALAGGNGYLPYTYDGLSADDLASLMTQWRERASATINAHKTKLAAE
jgi:hypothetical protein